MPSKNDKAARRAVKRDKHVKWKAPGRGGGPTRAGAMGEPGRREKKRPGGSAQVLPGFHSLIACVLSAGEDRSRQCYPLPLEQFFNAMTRGQVAPLSGWAGPDWGLRLAWASLLAAKLRLRLGRSQRSVLLDRWSKILSAPIKVEIKGTRSGRRKGAWKWA
jgi:hypothetical protein